METLSAKCKRFKESWTSFKELALQRRPRNHQTYSLELNICSNLKNRMFRKKELDISDTFKVLPAEY